MTTDLTGENAQTPCVRRRALERRGALVSPDPGGSRPFWLVTVTLGGSPLPEETVRQGLERLNHTRAFLVTSRYDTHRAEVRYWDEGGTAAEPVRQALELWGDEDVDEVLPGWALRGLGVADHDSARWQWLEGQHPSVSVLGEVLPFDGAAQLA